MSGLMQIAEPGMSSAPHEERLAVGIDLGTTNSLVATVVNGSVEVIADEKGRKILPSIVRFLPDGATEVGDAASEHLIDDAQNTVSSAKRLIGRDLTDILGQTLPYRFAESVQKNEGRRLVRDFHRAHLVLPDRAPVLRRHGVQNVRFNVFRTYFNACAIRYGAARGRAGKTCRTPRRSDLYAAKNAQIAQTEKQKHKSSD